MDTPDEFSELELPNCLKIGHPEREAWLGKHVSQMTPDERSIHAKQFVRHTTQEGSRIMQTDVETPTKTRKAVAKPAKAEKPVKAAKAPAKAASKPDKAAKPAKAPAKLAKPAKAPKAAKAKVEAAAKDVYGFREGSMKSQAAAMYSRKEGATLEEVKSALKSSQLNLLKELEAKGYKVKKVKEEGNGNKPVTRYHLAKRKT